MNTTHRPPMQASDEANEQQLELARIQGEAFKNAVDHMTHEEAHGAMQRAGDYLIGYAVESAEGMYHLSDGKLEWQEPAEGENLHVEVVVCDGGDGRFVPGLDVQATLTTEDGKEVGTHQQPFLWHPWLYHYGRNWQVPGDGVYSIKITVAAPDFPRHDRKNGNRFVDPVEVIFEKVQVQTGRK